LQGASATAKILQEFAGKPVRAFVVWEPVLVSDWGSPSTAAMGRIPDPRAEQFWDRLRLISHSMGERDRRSVVWDRILIYGAGLLWKDRPPEALYQGGPVVRVTEPARAALAQAVESAGKAR
jgi:hypothetical protein